MYRNTMIYLCMALMLLCYLTVVYHTVYAAELPEEYIDSGIPPAGWEGAAADVAAIRQYLAILLYAVLPFSFALLLVWPLFRRFYCTFIDGVL